MLHTRNVIDREAKCGTGRATRPMYRKSWNGASRHPGLKICPERRDCNAGRPSTTHEDKFHSENSSKQLWILLTPRLHSYSWNALASAFFTLRVSVYYLYVFYAFANAPRSCSQTVCASDPRYTRLLFRLDTEFAFPNSRSTIYLLFTTRF